MNLTPYFLNSFNNASYDTGTSSYLSHNHLNPYYNPSNTYQTFNPFNQPWATQSNITYGPNIVPNSYYNPYNGQMYYKQQTNSLYDPYGNQIHYNSWFSPNQFNVPASNNFYLN